MLMSDSYSAELPRFQAPPDSRPDDQPWPDAVWPVAPDTVLVGQLISLTPTSAADAADMFVALDHDAVWAHVRNRPVDTAAMRALIEHGLNDSSWCRWTLRAVRDVGGRKAGAVLGSSSYLETSVADARTEIGFTVYDPAVWATGVNAEAKLLLLGFAFNELNMGRVQLKTDIRNVRSQQAIARLGARYEGVLRRYQRRADGTVRDTVLFSITAEEWPQIEARLKARLTTVITAG
jgi:RimJ/RimL family protein N-acetyltransferase